MFLWRNKQNEPPHDKTWSAWASTMKKAWVLSYPLSAQRRLWSDWADAQADLSLRWAHMSVCWFCHEAAQIIHYHQIPTLSVTLSGHRKKNAITILKFWQCGLYDTGGFRSSLIWVYTVSPNMSVQKLQLRIITIILFISSVNEGLHS